MQLLPCTMVSTRLEGDKCTIQLRHWIWIFYTQYSSDIEFGFFIGFFMHNTAQTLNLDFFIHNTAQTLNLDFIYTIQLSLWIWIFLYTIQLKHWIWIFLYTIQLRHLIWIFCVLLSQFFFVNYTTKQDNKYKNHTLACNSYYMRRRHFSDC